MKAFLFAIIIAVCGSIARSQEPPIPLAPGPMVVSPNVTIDRAGTAHEKRHVLQGPLPAAAVPDQYTLVFTRGNVQDRMPTDPAVFEAMLKNMQRTGINGIFCKYLPWRLPLCEKYGVRMVIDLSVREFDLKHSLLADPAAIKPADLSNPAKVASDFKAVRDFLLAFHPQLGEPDPAKKQQLVAAYLAVQRQRATTIACNVAAICRQVKGSPGVWGYGLWYDYGTDASILDHAVEKLRRWDPTHPVLVGSYRGFGLETLGANPGCIGWYDFHWERGDLWHYYDLLKGQQQGKRLGSFPYLYGEFVGINKDLFDVNQTIAAGSKMSMWFVGGPQRKDDTWDDGHELVQIAAELRPMYAELIRIGQPLAVYSTPVTATPGNLPCPKGLPKFTFGIPANCWVQVDSGEVLLGLFKYADGTRRNLRCEPECHGRASRRLTIQLHRAFHREQVQSTGGRLDAAGGDQCRGFVQSRPRPWRTPADQMKRFCTYQQRPDGIWQCTRCQRAWPVPTPFSPRTICGQAPTPDCQHPFNPQAFTEPHESDRRRGICRECTEGRHGCWKAQRIRMSAEIQGGRTARGQLRAVPGGKVGRCRHARHSPSPAPRSFHRTNPRRCPGDPGRRPGAARLRGPHGHRHGGRGPVRTGDLHHAPAAP